MRLVHKKIVHKKRKDMSTDCPFCLKNFSRHDSMKKHMKSVHKGEISDEKEFQGSQPKRNCSADITSNKSDESMDDLN